MCSCLQVLQSGHGPIVDHFVKWCEISNLDLDISKTKDMVIDIRKQAGTPGNTIIKGQTFKLVQTYKYLGTIIDSSLRFEANCEAVCRRGTASFLPEVLSYCQHWTSHVWIALSLFPSYALFLLCPLNSSYSLLLHLYRLFIFLSTSGI